MKYNLKLLLLLLTLFDTNIYTSIIPIIFIKPYKLNRIEILDCNCNITANKTSLKLRK
jgi:hypothetical protein